MATKIYVVGNKVDIPDLQKVSQHNYLDTIVFVGKMNYEPNVVAVLHFANNVFPILCLDYPKLKFVIVGAHPDERVKKMAKNENIIVTGYVESVEPYYQRATIVVAPMLSGAGIQNKIIQAMSYACCVVTTSIGAEGLHIDHEIAIVDKDESMIETISFLLSNRKARLLMGKRARQYVVNNLSEDIIRKQFSDFMSKLDEVASKNDV
nr:glycosyltransferase family 4 protein [uncultured Bacteroides sp.]